MDKSQFKVINFRGTIFTPTVPYNNENLQKILPVLPGFTPSVDNSAALNPQLTPFGNGIFIPNPTPSWRMNSTDNKITVIFQEQKVDVVFNVLENYSEQLILEYSNKCYEMLSAIVDAFGLSMYRLAIAPKLEHIVNQLDELQVYSQSVFAETYKGNNIGNATFSKVYRNNETLCDRQYLINYLVNVTNGNHIKQIGNNIEIKDTICADFDINTYQDPAYRFNKDCMRVFFEQAPHWFDDYCTFILN